MKTLTKKQLGQAKVYYAKTPPNGFAIDPRVETLVNKLIGRVADKWVRIQS
jgi:hypothetical protein